MERSTRLLIGKPSIKMGHRKTMANCLPEGIYINHIIHYISLSEVLRSLVCAWRQGVLCFSWHGLQPSATMMMRLAGCRWVRCQPLGGSPGRPRVGAAWYAIPMVTIRLPCWKFFFWEVFFWEGTTGPLKSHHFWETGASDSSHIISSDNFHWQVPMPGLIPYFSGKLTMSLCTYFYLACPGTRIEP